MTSQQVRPPEAMAALLEGLPVRTDAERSWHSENSGRLSAVAHAWRERGHEPASASTLSAEEYVAVCVAVGRPQLLAEPVVEFLSLDVGLRRWALQERGRCFAWQLHRVGARISSQQRAREAALLRLGAIAERWMATGVEPDELGVLSSGELRAVSLAARRPDVLRDPVGDFLCLDGWLQQWVLSKTGTPSLVGQVIGRLSD
jgi:hypothetical protein